MQMLKTPFPWAGNKKRQCPEIWARLGQVDLFVDSFCATLSSLLSRPGGAQGVERVNDLCCNITNFWRAVIASPNEVAYYCQWPVNEIDLNARHKWLCDRSWGEGSIKSKLMADPEWFDAKQAGWWAWGQCVAMGTRWCGDPSVSTRGHARPLGAKLIHQKPRTIDVPPGVASPNVDAYVWLQALQHRLARVQVLNGDFERTLTAGTTWKAFKKVGILLDPPYGQEMRATMLYPTDLGIDGADEGPAARARRWAIENGNNPKLRIALCGLSQEHSMPDGWTAYEWTNNAGYSSIGGAGRTLDEVIWFSPYCLDKQAEQLELLAG